MMGALLRHAAAEFRSRGEPMPASPPTLVPAPPLYYFRLRSIDGHGRRDCCQSDCTNEARWIATITTPTTPRPDLIRCDIHAILLVQDAMKARR